MSSESDDAYCRHSACCAFTSTWKELGIFSKFQMSANGSAILMAIRMSCKLLTSATGKKLLHDCSFEWSTCFVTGYCSTAAHSFCSAQPSDKVIVLQHSLDWVSECNSHCKRQALWHCNYLRSIAFVILKHPMLQPSMELLSEQVINFPSEVLTRWYHKEKTEAQQV